MKAFKTLALEMSIVINVVAAFNPTGPPTSCCLVQGAAFNVTHFELTILLVWVVGGVADNGGWVSCGLGFSEQWNVVPCSSAYFVGNSSC